MTDCWMIQKETGMHLFDTKENAFQSVVTTYPGFEVTAIDDKETDGTVLIEVVGEDRIQDRIYAKRCVIHTAPVQLFSPSVFRKEF